MNRKISVSSTKYLNLALMLALLFGALGWTSQPVSAQGDARLSISGVKKGESITLKAEDFPANKQFRVLMNVIGTQGVDGMNVGTATTDKNGDFTKTFAIPRDLRTRSRIAVRIEATDSSGYYAYNWFDNVSSGTVTGSPSSGGNSSNQGSIPPTGGTSTGGAILTIVSVVEDTSVDIEATRLPANTDFRVFLEWKNNRGVVNSVRVDTLTSNRNGVIDETISIPRVLRDRRQLSVRLIALDGSNIAVVSYFLNASSKSGVGGGTSSLEDGIPILEVDAVVQNDTVTISASNLPPRTEFVILMGRMGSRGENGYEVDTVKSDKKGNLTGTFDIPRKLKDRDDIAIRIEASDDAGIYAYTWFDNETSE